MEAGRPTACQGRWGDPASDLRVAPTAERTAAPGGHGTVFREPDTDAWDPEASHLSEGHRAASWSSLAIF